MREEAPEGEEGYRVEEVDLVLAVGAVIVVVQEAVVVSREVEEGFLLVAVVAEVAVEEVSHEEEVRYGVRLSCHDFARWRSGKPLCK